MKFYIRTNSVDEPELGTGIVRNLSPTFADEAVSSAVEHHGVPHIQLFPKKSCLKVVSEVTDPFEAGALGWVDRYSSGQCDIH
jgi:hypothetical protein